MQIEAVCWELPSPPHSRSAPAALFRPSPRSLVSWTDEELGAAIAGGDTDAEGELFLRFRPKVRRQVEHALRDRGDCEDTTSEILQAAIAALRRGSFRGECRLSTFLHAVARNKIGEQIRRKRPETTELTEELGLAAPGPAPDESASHLQLAVAVRRALLELKPKYREVLCFYFYQQLSVAEIAEKMQVSARTVSEWKDYALRVIRSRFGSSLRALR
jgi:RNA polymerase sigma-70 factor (ECF subfamily)